MIQDLRHTHVSGLVADGWDPVEVAARIGDTLPTTLRVFAHEFDARRRSEQRRAALEARYGGEDGYRMATNTPNGRRQRNRKSNKSQHDATLVTDVHMSSVSLAAAAATLCYMKHRQWRQQFAPASHDGRMRDLNEAQIMSTNDRNHDPFGDDGEHVDEPPDATGAEEAADSRGDASDPAARNLVPLPDERAEALAAMCERLLQELDGEEVSAAGIRFLVHKPERADEYQDAPRQDAGPPALSEDRELVWELRRLIAWSAGTIADAAQTLEARAVDVDDKARALLQDEVEALDMDLGVLKALLADPVDWDREYERLLAGEIPPFDDPVGDEDDESHD